MNSHQRKLAKRKKIRKDHQEKMRATPTNPIVIPEFSEEKEVEEESSDPSQLLEVQFVGDSQGEETIGLFPVEVQEDKTTYLDKYPQEPIREEDEE